jgi:hypothetical protein
MNQPTREEFERLEAEQRQLKEEQKQLREEVRQLREHPIHVTVDHQLTGYEPFKDLFGKLDAFQNQMTHQLEGMRADIANLQATQSDLQEWRKEDVAYREMHTDRLDRLTEVLDQTLTFAASADEKLNHMATKDDLTMLATKGDINGLADAMATKDDLSKLGATMVTRNDLTRLESMMQQLLQQRGEN